MTREEYLTELFKSYLLIKVLSSKNECKVIRARNKLNNKDIIIRSYPTVVSAYEELYHLQCDCLPLVYDVINLQDGQIVLEEFIDGLTIAEVMESGKYKKIGVRRVMRSVCCALSILHQRNLVHRDLKPENVMVSPHGRVVLIDFNASRRMSAGSKDTVIMGTVGYASPEQLGVKQTDARTDIYAAGILLNVMLTGKHPSEKIAKGRFGRIIRKCTEINPDNRYQTAEKLLDII